MLTRVLETEVMDTPLQAADYDAMDHDAVNRQFVDDLIESAERHGFSLEDATVLDLGTGTALIPIELCRRMPGVRVVAVDAARSMLAMARANIEHAELSDRITLEMVDAKTLPHADGEFEAVISNSIVHHIPKPADVLAELWRVTGSSGFIFVRDLLRPTDQATLTYLAQHYAGKEKPTARQMFSDSLHASLTVHEMQEQVAELGACADDVSPTTDRHWTWATRKGQ